MLPVGEGRWVGGPGGASRRRASAAGLVVSFPIAASAPCRWSVLTWRSCSRAPPHWRWTFSAACCSSTRGGAAPWSRPWPTPGWRSCTTRRQSRLRRVRRCWGVLCAAVWSALARGCTAAVHATAWVCHPCFELLAASPLPKPAADPTNQPLPKPATTPTNRSQLPPICICRRVQVRLRGAGPGRGSCAEAGVGGNGVLRRHRQRWRPPLMNHPDVPKRGAVLCPWLGTWMST